MDTSADARSRSPSVGSGVFGLRAWGTSRCYLLPNGRRRCLLGTSHDCDVTVLDPKILSVHAQLTRERKLWLIRALGEDAELWCDGARLKVFSLEPGAEVTVGQTTLIAEDDGWRNLRAFCARILGWDGKQTLAVDHALRSIRMSLTHRAPLVLRGDEDMVPIAWALHKRVLGVDRPFIVCDPRRRDSDATVRSAESRSTVAAALKAAIGGSLVVRTRRLPQGFSALLAKVAEPSANMQLIVCQDRSEMISPWASPIAVPPLTTRRQDLPRIITEYAQDAILELGVPAYSFQREHYSWITEYAAGSLDEIEKATLRRLAVATTKSMERAGEVLGMSAASLVRWLGRRRLGP